MSLLFRDDEVEALEAALSYVEALPPSQPALEISAASSTTAFPEGFGAGDEGEVRLDAELDRLLLGTLSSSSEHVSESTPMAAMSTTLVTTPMASSLSSPLPLMVANVGAPNVSGQTRRRSRAAKGPTTTLAKRRVKKRARQQVSGCAEVVGASGDLSSQGCTLDFLVDKDTYEALLTSVETAYAELEAVFATNGEKHRGVVYENATKHLETSSDTIMEAFTMEFLGKTTTADFRVKQVIRRFVESDRQVVVWVSIGHALDPNNSPFSSFGFVDKGYVVTRRPMSIAPGHGDFTILQMCSLVSPQMSAGCRIDMTAAGDFTEFVLNVVAANTTTSQEIIENVLLDQALNKRQVETSLAA
ncbi:hypothetical protein PC117_g10201 [Phytophthora cactorum]|uniref:Uncharacterized protein n=1 Tax=Phytophthora cactorum TaxID=29920 RepID=A0A8T1DME1_9STRA|nr:hypothetical protein PC117_g10201 [Phytophthora cactorum]